MEYSIAQSLDQNGDSFNVPFPILRSDPVSDQVNPGIAQIVSLYETIVPMPRNSLYSLEKKMDTEVSVAKLEKIVEHEKIVEDAIMPQIGSGESQIDPNILSSFKHPIVTDSIIFAPKADKKPSKHKLSNVGSGKPAKMMKTDHKFHVV